MHQIYQMNKEQASIILMNFVKQKLRFQGKTLQDLQQERKGAIF